MGSLERFFEGFLWRSRLAVLVAVVCSLVSAFAVLYLATVDTWSMLIHLFEYGDGSLSDAARASLRSRTIAHVVEVIDGYLLATVLFIFALGLYELFISRIDLAYEDETASKVLVIETLDHLKDRLAKVVLMILIVKYFEHAIGMEFNTPMELLIFAAGIALIGLALYLSHAGGQSR